MLPADRGATSSVVTRMYSSYDEAANDTWLANVVALSCMHNEDALWKVMRPDSNDTMQYYKQELNDWALGNVPADRKLMEHERDFECDQVCDGQWCGQPLCALKCNRKNCDGKHRCASDPGGWFTPLAPCIFHTASTSESKHDTVSLAQAYQPTSAQILDRAELKAEFSFQCIPADSTDTYVPDCTKIVCGHPHTEPRAEKRKKALTEAIVTVPQQQLAEIDSVSKVHKGKFAMVQSFQNNNISDEVKQ